MNETADYNLRQWCEELLVWLERNKHLSDPLTILEKWDVPTADQQGYLAGLNAAAFRLRNVLKRDLPADKANFKVCSNLQQLESAARRDGHNTPDALVVGGNCQRATHDLCLVRGCGCSCHEDGHETRRTS